MKSAPSDQRDLTIWRYLSIDKFEWMLTNRKLYFPQLGRMIDTYEGRFRVIPLILPPDGLNPEFREFLCGLNDGRRSAMMEEIIQKDVFISCWCCRDDEDFGLWDRYAREGVAIRSSTATFETNVPMLDESGNRIWETRHIRYSSDPDDPARVFDESRGVFAVSMHKWLAPVFVKLTGYDSEREWRAAIYQEYSPEEPRELARISHRVSLWGCDRSV